MTCDFCGMEKPTKGACPICGKGCEATIEIVKADTAEPPTEIFRCSCGARCVIEVVAHETGLTNLLYLLDRNILPLDEDWEGMKDPQVVDIYCAKCNKQLTSEEKLLFFRETD